MGTMSGAEMVCKVLFLAPRFRRSHCTHRTKIVKGLSGASLDYF